VRAAEPERRRGAWQWPVVGIAALVGLGWLIADAVRKPATPTMATPTVPGPTLPVPGVKPPEATPPEPARVEAPASASVTTLSQYLDSNSTAPRRFVMEGITFATGSAALTPEGQTTVTDLALALKAHPDASIAVEGFSDNTGSAALNQQLARSRADSVKSALAAQGVDESRVQTSGRAEDKPVTTNQSAAGREQNRRVEVVVTPR
jgi:outer membrane protein OmpA-like peptidoglycan-associated protein